MHALTTRIRALRGATVVWHDFHLPWWGWVAAVACVLLDASLHSPWDIDPTVAGQFGIPSLFAGWVLAAALAVETWRHVRRTWWAYALLAILLAVTAAIALGSAMTWPETLMMIANAIGEELSFRIALPLLVYGVLTRLLHRMPEDARRMIAIVAAAAVFTIAPGHVEQMSGITGWMPFFGIAIAWGLAVQATGAWLAVGLLHASTNLLTYSHWSGDFTGAAPMLLRGAGVAVIIALIAVSTRTRPRASEVTAAADDAHADATDTGDAHKTGTSAHAPIEDSVEDVVGTSACS